MRFNLLASFQFLTSLLWTADGFVIVSPPLESFIGCKSTTQSQMLLGNAADFFGAGSLQT
jgi:hypothetical protein